VRNCSSSQLLFEDTSTELTGDEVLVFTTMVGSGEEISLMERNPWRIRKTSKRPKSAITVRAAMGMSFLLFTLIPFCHTS
jgi:hypothetical protein